MADWSQLPMDLLQQISNKLNNNEIYLLCFRSVCSTWRSSVPNYTHNIHFPLKLPKPSNPKRNAPSGYLIRHSIFLIKPPKTSNQQNLRPWLMSVGPSLNGKTHLSKPLYFHDGLPFHLPPVLDFNRFPVIDLGHTFHLIEGDSLQEPHKVYLSDVVAATGEQPIDIVTYDNNFGEPKMFRFGGNSWTSIYNWQKLFSGDICIFKGRPCVAYKTGLTVMIRPDLSIHLLAEPFSHGRELNISLVESGGELLLVHEYCKNGCCGNTRMNVFRLDEKEKKWVKLTNLGDKVLFLLGDGCSFSASASDLGFSNGNCVIFNSVIVMEDYIDCGLKIIHLDQDWVSPLSKYPDYFKMFGPPPEWIVELHS